ncbi:MAG: glycosyltransferase [Nitrospiraceae bacterium]|nr:MAG: glycosyltransferase [Nitrospiraceae bacterium]
MTADRVVSIIIPTLATAERSKYLLRAIESALSQQGVQAIPIVIANGGHGDAGLLDHLRQRRDIRYARLEQASQPMAMKAGRDMVDTPFFSILDDDDLLLPHAMSTRLGGMQSGPEIDVVVTNGIISNRWIETVNITDFSGILVDPLRKLQEKNWMLTGSGLFRTATMSREFFGDMPQYLEWTYLAMRISLEKRKILFINNPSVVHFLDHDFSIYRSKQAVFGQPRAIERILELDLPRDVRVNFEIRLADANNEASKLYLRGCNFPSALSSHIKTVRCRSGWRHLFYIKDFRKKGLAFFRKYSSAVTREIAETLQDK